MNIKCFILLSVRGGAGNIHLLCKAHHQISAKKNFDKYQQTINIIMHETEAPNNSFNFSCSVLEL